MSFTNKFFEAIAKKQQIQTWSKSDLDNPHIKRAISELAKISGRSEEELTTVIKSNVEKRLSTMTNKILHETVRDNIVEGEVFDLFHEIKQEGSIVEGAPVFKDLVFTKLIQAIRIENPSYFPMKTIISQKSLPPVIHVVPKEGLAKSYNEVTTAAANAKCEFMFNRGFMQRLLDWGHIKGITHNGKFGKKYKSNGGFLPDEYAYIEFLIHHEFMHYTDAHFHEGNKLKLKSKHQYKVLNYATDFRINEELVRDIGLPQLPMGLFNEHINFKKQKSIAEMYNIVDKELKELQEENKKKDKPDEKGEGGDSGDDEFDKPEGGEPGEKGEDGDDDFDDGLDTHDDHDKSTDEEYEDDTGDGDGESSGKHGKPSDKDEKSDKHSTGNEDLDKAMEKMEKNREERKEKEKDIKPIESAEDLAERLGKVDKSDRQAGKNDLGSKIKLEEYKADITWNRLLDKLIGRVFSHVMDTSYAKSSSKNIIGAVLSASGSPGAVKQGDIKIEENKKKFILVIDQSGSMSSVISKLHSQLMSVIQQKAKQNTTDDFYIVRFSDKYDCYKCSFSKKSSQKVDISEIYSKSNTVLIKGGGTPVLKLLEDYKSGGTVFSVSMADALLKATKAGNSVCIFSDDDILDADNQTVVANLLTKSQKGNIGFVMKDYSIMSRLYKAFGAKYSRFVTHM